MLINMRQLLEVANEKNFAVPAFNISQDAMFKGIMEACEQHQSPVIIAIHPDELSFIGDDFIKMIISAAKNSKLPISLHLDHGSSPEQIQRAIRDGFTSVMIDASLNSFEENVSLTKKVIELAHPVDVSVEAELGTIGTTDGDKEGGTDEIIYTKVEDAKKFVELTNCDALAIAIGTAHGIYPENFKPKLRLDILDDIKKEIKIPLVLHGGSANPDSEIGEAVKRGVNKINISSDIKHAFFTECRKVLEDKKVREPNVIFPSCIEKMKEVAIHKIQLFQSNDKAKFYK